MKSIEEQYEKLIDVVIKWKTFIAVDDAFVAELVTMWASKLETSSMLDRLNIIRDMKEFAYKRARKGGVVMIDDNR